MRSFTFSLLCASVAALSFPSDLSGRDSTNIVAQLQPRVDDPFGGQVAWTDMTSGDGANSRGDSDKIWYLQDFITKYLDRIPAENRNGVFWAGGSTSEDDFDYIDEFIESPTRLDSQGVKADMVYPLSDFQAMGLDGTKTQLWWRAINRMSKALAASASGGGIAYVYLRPVNCRTIFSPPSQNPQDNDPDHGGVATNGEIWYYAELPMLMRNTNINQIVTFYKNGRKFETKVEWDATRDAATHPRNEFDDIAMDASPIVLPAAAGRAPLKKRRAFVPRFEGSNTTMTTLPIEADTTTTWATWNIPTTTPDAVEPTTESTSLLVPVESSTDVVSEPANTETPTSFVAPTTEAGTPTSDPVVEETSTTLIPPTSDVTSDPIGTPSAPSTDIPVPTTTVALTSDTLTTNPVAVDSTTETSVLGEVTSTTFAAATTTDAVPTSATTGAVVIPGLVVVDGTTVITGGDITSPIPVTVTTSIDPKGTEASSSAIAIQSSIIALIPDIQNYIDNPSKDKADNANNNIIILLPLVTNLFGSLSGSPDPNPKPCSASTNLIKTLFNAVSCVVDNLTKVTSQITKSVEDEFKNLEDITSTLALLQGLEEPLDTKNDEEEDDENSSKTDQQSSTEASTAESTTEATTETCTATITASDCLVICPTATSGVTLAATASCSTTCFSTVSGCDATAYTTTSYTVEACLLPTGDLAAPTGDFVGVWWDYGLSCAGNCGAYTLPSASVDEATSTTGVAAEATSTTTEGVPTSETTTPGLASVTSITSDLSTPVPSTLVTSIRTTESDLTSDTTETTTTEDLTTTEATTDETTTLGQVTTPGQTTTMDAASTTADITTTEAPQPTIEGWPFCGVFGGPRVATPYCQCSTTEEGQTFFATATLIDGQCTGYTSFPSDITLAPTEAPTTAPHVAEPYTETTDGTVLAYPDRTVEYGNVYTGIKVTFTYGVGTPTTISTPVPTQTDSNNKGSSQCHSIDDACDRAFEQFEDAKVYTQFTSYYSRIKSGIIVAATFGQAGCTAQWDCDDFGIGMTGLDIKNAVQYMKDNDGVTKCGTTYLSNTCHVTLNYCTNCHHIVE
ncbi:hypothetical protein BGZ61DRAFT_540341 [Ilyonectria robusta]|uniref:uncharacterized protein n=1 Tax=Ilyonectria robusta TaxID=1079257 RepID=UPI001E8E46DD|nr:uncharacterized protein BGZ61DRAFT_540341 [Ilyonectria robusta]KAH8659000.1 hypothetical protein BGZ61DRAFT_540341 [Ilyonectria robusta]